MTGIVITDAMVKRAASEYLEHKGENPWRVLRRGAELWEDHAPAIRAALQAALTNQPESGDDKAAIDYALRYGGMCRDCADTRVRGICDNSGMPCDPEVCRKVITHALAAWRYGLKHGYLAASPILEKE